MILRLLKLFVSLGVAVGDAVYRQLLNVVGRRLPPVCIVLYYHGIPSEKRTGFGRQMDHLLQTCSILRGDYTGPLEMGRRYSVVTFDDGLVSVVENALPELHARGIACTMFVPTGSLGTDPSWYSHHGPANTRERVVSPRLLQTLGDDEYVTIGSHSIWHPDFRTIDDDRARLELQRSKSDLEAIVNKDVTLFSFPHGGCNQRSIELARQAGYARVFTIDPTPARFSGNDFVCGRVRTDPGEWSLEFRLKARGAYRWLSAASAWKRSLLEFAGGRRLLNAGSEAS